MLGSPMTSFVLSQFFGLYLLIVAIIMISRVHAYRRMAQKMDPESGTLVLVGLIGLLLGLFFVGIHNVWIFNPILIVTLLCWLTLMCSILLLSTPERMVDMIKRVFRGSGYYVLITVMALLGFVLLIRGVYLYATHQHAFFFLA